MARAKLPSRLDASAHGPRDPADSLTPLIAELVRIPSRGGLDDCRPVVDLLLLRMRQAHLHPTVLTEQGQPAAVACDIEGERPGPRYVLNACLDTAGIGDPEAWSGDPFSGRVQQGWLHGRGSADSKAAVAVFTHLGADLSARPDAFAGTLSLLFDLDEHTGRLAGIRRYLDLVDDVAGVMIGYPGAHRVVTGARGLYRATITVLGQAAHTAATRHHGVNAIGRAARIVGRLLDMRLPIDPTFPHPPKVTVTSIHGGDPGVHSVVPDRVDIDVEVRLTPAFTADDAHAAVLRALCPEDDGQEPAGDIVTIRRTGPCWPAYQLPARHPLPAALLAGARGAGLSPRPGPAGPSNIGCYLASRGIPATAGFGVAYRGLHSTDEAIDTQTLPAVYQAYRTAVLSLLTG